MRALALALVALLALSACSEVDQRAVDCRKHGGVTRDSDMTHVGITSNGKIGFTPVTIRYCINDGKITDLWQV